MHKNIYNNNEFTEFSKLINDVKCLTLRNGNKHKS